jgi:myo-inositol-1(or 4)-monophosphatase
MKIKQIQNELKLAKKAALEAGDLLLNNKNYLKKEILSSSRDIKLDADLISEGIIKEILLKHSKFPVLAEESGKSKESLGEIFWVVDPLDGTANYARGIPLYCISIALMYKLQPVLGVIYDFSNKNIYEGSTDSEAKLNDSIIRVSSISAPNTGVL